MAFLLQARDSPAPPNGSRLSCGASAGGRKRPVLRYLLGGAQTYRSAEGRPRQLQALVRLHASFSNVLTLAVYGIRQ